MFDDIDNMEVDINLRDMGIISRKEIIQGALDGMVSIDQARKKLAAKIEDNVHLEKARKQFKKRRQRVSRMMNTAPFQRKKDKFAYLLGSNFAIFFGYLLGKFPHDHVYTYINFMMGFLLCHRYYDYITNGYYYYLADWCYFANFALLYFINFDPKNELLQVTCYLFANGAIAVAIVAFRNSLVYHKIDMLTSLAIHAVPLILNIHIRWVTIPLQQHLPPEEQRFNPTPVFETWGEWFHCFFVYPLRAYSFFLFCYSTVMFVLTDKVRKFEIECTYTYFAKGLVLPKWLGPIALLPLPIVFILSMWTFTFVAHLIACITYYNYYVNHVVAFFLMQWAVYNGACFYMDYFSKRYEKQLEKLDQLET